MNIKKKDLQLRTKSFAIFVIKFVMSLKQYSPTDVISKQLLRSSTSVGANYRAACRARSTADFISKMGIVEEEIDESIYWFELLVECNIIEYDSIKPLLLEANELLSIIVASIKTAKKNKRKLIRIPQSEIPIPN
ncbi:four helix bundle protein [Chlamydiota bacterium]